MPGEPHRSTQVLVPVKAFARAKSRLSGVLDAPEREALARLMAEVVLDAADGIATAVVCDDEAVAEWARSRGATVGWTPGLDLNGALTHAVRQAASSGFARVVIAHADLPFATDLSRFAEAPADRVVIISDRHGDGTNVMSLPTGRSMDLRYGPGSRAAHIAAAEGAGLEAVEVLDEALAWDVDEPDDLSPPPGLGSMPAGNLAPPAERSA